MQIVKIEVSKTKYSWFGLAVFRTQGFYYQRLGEQTISSKIIQDGVRFSLTMVPEQSEVLQSSLQPIVTLGLHLGKF